MFRIGRKEKEGRVESRSNRKTENGKREGEVGKGEVRITEYHCLCGHTDS